MKLRWLVLTTSILLASLTPLDAQKPPASLQMGGKKSVTSFFITSRGPGHGGNLGGLAGADAHCRALAKKEGSDDHTWRAYLSTMAADGAPAINARDRIGKGPWYNALGDRIALNVQDLHSDRNKIDLDNAVTERGDAVGLDMHDILTGSQADGTAYSGGVDRTCGNWTSSLRGTAQAGHHDRMGLGGDRSWNSAHPTRGCSQHEFAATAGAGLFYCFAID
jgi:hypothetical protein